MTVQAHTLVNLEGQLTELENARTELAKAQTLMYNARERANKSEIEARKMNGNGIDVYNASCKSVQKRD